MKLHSEKLEFIVMGNEHTRESLTPIFLVTFLQSSITPAEEVKNLGVTFDTENTIGSHIYKVCCVYCYHPRDL